MGYTITVRGLGSRVEQVNDSDWKSAAGRAIRALFGDQAEALFWKDVYLTESGMRYETAIVRRSATEWDTILGVANVTVPEEF